MLRVVTTALVMGMATTTAAGSPLGVVWRQPGSCPSPGPNTLHPDMMFATGDSLVWIDQGHLARRSRADGKLSPVRVKLSTSQPQIHSTAQDRVIIGDATGVAVHDARTGKHLWRHAIATPSPPTHELGVAAEDITVVQATKHGGAQRRMLELLDGKTGRVKWSKPVPSPGAETRWVGGSATHIFVFSKEAASSDTSIAAFRRGDGRLVWTTKAFGVGYGGTFALPFGPEIVFEGFNSLVFLDAKGAATTIPRRNSSLSGARLVGDRLYVVSNQDLIAVELASRKILWRALLEDVHAKVIYADSTSIYVADGDTLRELDRNTGKPVATLGIAETTVFGAEGGTPSLFACTGNELVALDRSAVDIPLETATVSGRLVCKSCGWNEPVDVALGPAKTQTDRRGRFRIKVTGRGRYNLRWLFPESGTDTVVARVSLNGKPSYKLGNVVVVFHPE